jgi:hypothetical protein
MHGMGILMAPLLQVGGYQVQVFLDSLINEIINWALVLEHKEMINEGLTFSNNDKQAAESVVYTITNNIGSMQNSQLQQASDNSKKLLNFTISNDDIAPFIELLKSSIGQLNLQNTDKA